MKFLGHFVLVYIEKKGEVRRRKIIIIITEFVCDLTRVLLDIKCTPMMLDVMTRGGSVTRQNVSTR